jgi:hypothetical protein
MNVSSGIRSSRHDYTEEGESRYLQNVGKYVQNYTVSHPTVEYIVIHGRKYLKFDVNIAYLNSKYFCTSEGQKFSKKIIPSVLSSISRLLSSGIITSFI